jgi:hypothetical protein
MRFEINIHQEPYGEVTASGVRRQRFEITVTVYEEVPPAPEFKLAEFHPSDLTMQMVSAKDKDGVEKPFEIWSGREGDTELYWVPQDPFTEGTDPRYVPPCGLFVFGPEKSWVYWCPNRRGPSDEVRAAVNNLRNPHFQNRYALQKKGHYDL